MKKLFAIVAIITMSAFAAINASAQCCPTPVASSCYGDCGGTMPGTITYTAPASGCYTVCVESNLCASTGTKVIVKVNGKTKVRATLQNYESRSFCVNAGDVITVESTNAGTQPGVNCIVGGSTTTRLCTN